MNVILYDLPLVDGAEPPPLVGPPEPEVVAAPDVGGVVVPDLVDDEHAARATTATATPVVATTIGRFISAPLPKNVDKAASGS